MGSKELRQRLLFVISFVITLKTIESNSKKLFVSSDNCSESEYFDTKVLSCESCVSPHRYDKEVIHQLRYQIRSSDGFSCVCRPGYRPDFDKSALYCVNDTNECPNGSRSMNGYQCASCDSDNTANNSTDSCLCLKHYHLVDSLNTTNPNVIDLKCEKCHQHLTSDGISCKPCHQSYIMASKQCDCPERTHIEEDGMCLEDKWIKKYNLNAISEFEMQNTNKKLISDYFYRRTRPAIHNCKNEFNQTACQLLANLCVLYHYSYSETNSNSNICEIFLELNPNIDLYYKGYYKNSLKQNDVPNRFKINDKLEFIASRFAINGQLIEYSDLKTNELQLCFENQKSSESGFVFNTNFKQTCVRTVRQLWDNYKKNNVFYDLYLKYNNSKETTIYPIPLLVKNLRHNGKLVNNDIDDYDTNEEQHAVVLTRRLFLIDTITGVEKTSDDINYQKTRPKFIRIAKSIEIDISLLKQDGQGSIFPPLITIYYETLYQSDYEINSEIEISFSINYSMNDWKTERDLSVAISVLCCASILWAIFRTWCWAKRNGKIAIDFPTVTEFLVNSIAMISLVFFAVNIVFAINIFLMFKNQSVIHTLLTTEGQEYSLIVFIIIAFILKSIHLFYKLLVISTVDIFFIDWERPKKRDINSSVATLRPKSVINFNDNESEDNLSTERQNTGSRLSISGSLTSPSPKPMADKPLYEFPNVTVWRFNFVANEWMELSAERRLNLSLHIILVILSLDWFGFANLAISEPKNSFTSDETQRYIPQNTTLRLAIGALVYLILSVLNIAFNKFIYESLFNNKLNQFVDLCSVCNISLFVLLYKRFGYYVHGLAANGKSDVNMLEMYELLEREENDLCSKRGLLPNSDHQTFEMSVPSAISEHYQRVRNNSSGFGKISERMRSFGSHSSKADKEKLIPTYLMINKFLTGFIEHNFKDVDYMVREKSTIESILDVEFNDIRDKGVFYSDNGHSFEAILFYGLEFTLLSFEMMLFLVSDLCFQSFTFSAAVTYVVSKIIKKLYLSICRKNLIRKALIDQRFLI